MTRARLGARRHFGEDQAAFVHGLLPRLVLGRVEDVDPAGDDSDRAAVERAVMRRAVDPAGEARDDDEVALAEIVSKAAREAARRRRGIARADDRHRRPVEQVEVALRHQQRRRVLELGQQPRIEPLPQRQELGAELVDPRDLALGIVAAAEPGRLPAATPGEIGHGRERGRGAAEAHDQLAVSDRSDTGRTDQPEAVYEVVDQALVLPMRGSVPALRRAIFSRCFHSTSNVKPSSIG